MRPYIFKMATSQFQMAIIHFFFHLSSAIFCWIPYYKMFFSFIPFSYRGSSYSHCTNAFFWQDLYNNNLY